MIKYNYEYTYSRGNGKITFTEGKGGIVMQPTKCLMILALLPGS